MNKNLTPIIRINKFFSEADFELEQSMGRECIEGDGNFVIILYRVDRTTTEHDDLYGEASKDGIRYYPPIELRVVPILSEPENKAYNPNGGLRYVQDGKFTFALYIQQLEELDVDISYGDYVGYPVTESEVRYFTVVNDNALPYDNKHTIIGYKKAFKTIVCSVIDSSEFNGI